MEIDQLEVKGEERERALERIEAQLQEWGIVMPSDGPYPLHFGLGEFDQIGETEFVIYNNEQAGYCGKFLFLFEGQTCPAHHHKIKHETFFVVKGTMHLRVGSETLTLSAGQTRPVPPGEQHEFSAVGGNLLILEVSTPSRVWDNVFADDRINALLRDRSRT